MNTIIENHQEEVISNSLEKVLEVVDIVPATDLFKNTKTILPSGMDYAIKSGDRLYGYVSNNFGLITPYDAYDAYMELFDKHVPNVVTHGKIDIKGNYELRFVNKTTQTILSERGKSYGDTVEPYVYFSNGLAGTRSTSTGGGIFRTSTESGMVSQKAKAMFVNPVRNTVNSQMDKLGIDLSKILPEIMRFYENFEQVTVEQRMLVDSEINDDDVLAYFYALTDGQKFPETKFQKAYDIMRYEMKNCGYTKLNKYLVYVGLNYVLENDSMGLDLNQIKKIDDTISMNIINLTKKEVMKHFDEIVYKEHDRLVKYQEKHGRLPRGKKKILELE